ncbi:MAG: hypothetical protein ACT4N2_02350, partial [Hyphomicrobium sp.]
PPPLPRANGSDRPAEPSVERTADKLQERSADRSAGRVPERGSDRAQDRSAERREERGQRKSAPTLEVLPSADQRVADEDQPQARRAARRRPAGMPRSQMAANDDAPSIGGLIYALEQKPSNAPFKYAGIASAVWVLIGGAFLWTFVGTAVGEGAGLTSLLARPTTFLMLSSIVVPVTVIWFLALLAWRSEELRLRSSTMTEVAVRLAEPDRMAEQSVASLGQAVRRQVAFMNDAVSRALGRAGELEALVHNEVSALERSYGDNERKIRTLIQELAGERQAILNTSGHVSDTLKQLGSEIPTLIDRLSSQQIKLAQIIQGAGENLTALESAVGQSTGRLETTLGARTEELQYVLEGYTNALGTALGTRTEALQSILVDHSTSLDASLGNRAAQMQNMLEGHSSALTSALGQRTEEVQGILEDHSTSLGRTLETYTTALATALGERQDYLQTVFEEYARALDTTFSSRAEALDTQLVERTRSLDGAFNERLRLFDESIKTSAMAIDSAVTDKALALTSALDSHAKTFSETISKQSMEIDESLMQGISSVRRTSENITRQSLKAIEGLAGQSEMLRNISENLLGQINTVTNRFETQGQGIMRAANSLETINYRIDQTLQARHNDLSQTLDRMSGKADEFGRFVEGYSTTIAGSLTDAETKARAVAHEIILGAEKTKQAALADLEQFRSEADAQGERALEDLRRRFSSVSSTVSSELDTLSSRFDATSEEVRQRAQRAASEIAAEQTWLRDQMDRLPAATRDSTDAMRRALQDQLKALEQLSSLTTRTAQSRDVSPPLALPAARTPAANVEPTMPTPRGVGALPPPPTADAQQRAFVPRQMPPREPSAAASPSQLGGMPQQAALPDPPLRTASVPPPAPGLPRSPGGPMAGGESAAWSLGDLLARASREDEALLGPVPAKQAMPLPSTAQSGAGPLPTGNALPAPPAVTASALAAAIAAPIDMKPATAPYQLNVDIIARALDPATTSAIWSRLKAGQHGIMVRSIYSPEGRAAFDEVSRRVKTDADLARTINRYLADFERIRREAETKDPSGRLVHNHLVSDTGRVYLFLAHASGRIT